MIPSTATAVEIAPVGAARSTVTLVDLVTELRATGATDREVVAAVLDLLETGRVRIIGQVCDETCWAR